MTPELAITRHGPAETLALCDEILPVYAAAEADQMHDPFYGEEQFLHRLVDLYAPGRDFELVTARLGGVMIGFAFGNPRDKTAAIWESVGKALPDVVVPEEPQPVYVFRELNVLPDYQGRGYGRALHDALLASRPERLAHLLVRPDNPARFAYGSWGWRKVGTQQPFPDSPVFDEMVKTLPL